MKTETKYSLSIMTDTGWKNLGVMNKTELIRHAFGHVVKFKKAK
jgi:hypothetical protein